MLKGQLIQKSTGEVGVIIDVHQTWNVEPYNTNKMGITRERIDYFCSILFGDELVQTKIFYRHNSYQVEPKIYTIDTRPEDLLGWAARNKRRIEVIG